jgi:hypothetical protein
MALDEFDCGLEDRLSTGGGVAVLFVRELLGRHASPKNKYNPAAGNYKDFL